MKLIVWKPAPAASSSSSTYDTTSRHAEGRVSKRSTSSEKRPLTPTPSLKRKRRSSGSPPRKRRTSPPPTSSSKSKTSYTAVTSRSGSLGKGGDRDLRESHPRSRSASWKRSSLSPQRSRSSAVVKKAKVHKKAPNLLSGANAVSIDSSEVHHTRTRGSSGSSRRPVSPVERGLSETDLGQMKGCFHHKRYSKRIHYHRQQSHYRKGQVQSGLQTKIAGKGPCHHSKVLNKRQKKPKQKNMVS